MILSAQQTAQILDLCHLVNALADHGCISPATGNSVDQSTASRSLEEMATTTPKPLTLDLLNKAEALIAAEVCTLATMAEAILPEKAAQERWNRVHEWIKQRKYPISNPEVVLRLQNFVGAVETDRYADYAKALKKIKRDRK